VRIRGLVAVCIMAALGCSSSSNNMTSQTFTSLQLNTSSASVFEFGGNPVTLTAVAKDQNGSVINNPGGTPTFAADPSGLVTISGNTVTAVSGASGTVNITATLTAQGKTLSSQPVSITVDVAPSSGQVAATNSLTFTPNVVHIKAGGNVAWSNLAGLLHNVDFTGTALPFNGNTTSGAPGSVDNATGTFGSAGTFSYHCDTHGLAMSGQVIVH